MNIEENNNQKQLPSTFKWEEILLKILSWIVMLIFITTWYQSDLTKAFKTYGLSFLFLILVSLLMNILINPIPKIIFTILFVSYIRFGVIHGYSYGIDLLIIGFFSCILLMTYKNDTKKNDTDKNINTNNQASTMLCISWIFIIWIVFSIADIFKQNHLNFDHNVITVPQPLEGNRLGLSLSGGGYRSALFHAGVLEAFLKLNIPIQAISSVSGGAIIGSFYARGGNPEDFLNAMKDTRLWPF